MAQFNIEAAIEMYYTQHDLNAKQIMEIFGCSRSRADTLKKQVRDKAALEEIRPLVFESYHVQTEYAYKVWGLDIADLERRFKGLQKFYKVAGRSGPATGREENGGCT